MSKCGSAHCRGGHIWLTEYALDTVNCGAHRDYSPEEIAEKNEEKRLTARRLTALEMP